MPSEKSQQIINELVQLAVKVVKYCQGKSLPLSVVDQITRSVTSIGANFSEAQDAGSKKDFINKIYIAKKEAAETKYWLAIITQLTGNNDEITDLSQKAQRFSMMLQKIITTSRTTHS